MSRPKSMHASVWGTDAMWRRWTCAHDLIARHQWFMKASLDFHCSCSLLIIGQWKINDVDLYLCHQLTNCLIDLFRHIPQRLRAIHCFVLHHLFFPNLERRKLGREQLQKITVAKKKKTQTKQKWISENQVLIFAPQWFNLSFVEISITAVMKRLEPQEQFDPTWYLCFFPTANYRPSSSNFTLALSLTTNSV